MKIEEIPLVKIDFKSNHRIDYEDMANLMQTIKSYGLLQPIGVKEDGNRYTIIWGHRRWKAFEKLGYRTIPAVIFSDSDENMTEEEFLIFQVVENFQKSVPSLKELGDACKNLRKTMSVSEIAAKLGLSKSRIKNALEESARIPAKWQAKIKVVVGGEDKKGTIPSTTAMNIANMRHVTPELKEQLYEFVSKNDISKENVIAIGSLMKTGRSLKEAINEVKEYRPVCVNLLVNRKKWDEHIERLGMGNREFIIRIINEKIPGLCIMNLRK